jgi:ligand-binding sensor domain-containing protein
MNKSIALLLFACLALALPTAEAKPSLFFYTVKNTNPTEFEFGLIQDHQGFIWLGGTDGLYRFDGYQFKHFGHDANNPGSLPHRFVADLFEDRQHRMWIATREGLAMFETKTGVFKTYLPGPDQGNPLQNRQIRKIASDGDHGIWLATREGLQHFDIDSGQFRVYRHDAADPDSLFRDNVDTLAADRQGGVWLATWPGGVDYLPAAASKFSHYQIDSSDKNPLANNVRALLVDSRQRLWLGTEAGIFLWQPGTDWSEKKYLPVGGYPRGFRVNSFYEDNNGVIWVATTVGLLRWDEDLRQFDLYRHHNEDPYSLVSNHVLSMTQDRSGVLWINTAIGTSRADASLTGIKQLVPKEFDGDKYTIENEVSALAPAEADLIWFGGTSS